MIYTHEAERQLAESSIEGLPPGYIVPLGCDEPPQSGRGALTEEFLSAHPHLRGRLLVTFLSRLHPKKGLDLLIPAFTLLSIERPSAHLVLVGPGDPQYIQHIRQLVEKYSLADRVTFTGPLEGRAKWAALAASNLFVLPSYQENFAIVVVEALRMGVPVVISRRINIWEDIVNAGGGVACDLDPTNIAGAIDSLLADPFRAGRIGAKGQQFVGLHFNWDRGADALAQVYQDCFRVRPLS